MDSLINLETPAQFLPALFERGGDGGGVDPALAEPALGFEIMVERAFRERRLDIEDPAFAVEDFADGGEAGLDGEADQLDAVGRLRFPPGRAGREQVQE